MKKICVYTCLTGDYDELKDVEIKDSKVDFICYTNNKNLKSNTWKVIYVDNDGLTNHQLSRKIKMLGTDYIDKNYDISVWQDASVTWVKKPSLFVEEHLKEEAMSCFVHAFRKCIYEEAAECVRMRKESREKAIDAVSFLEKEKFPHDYGLYEMTVFIKRHKDKKLIETMELWYDTYLHHSKRDQLSFMYAVWKTGLKVHPIEMSVWKNEWVIHSKHCFNKKLTEARVFYNESRVPPPYKYEYDYLYKYDIKDNHYSFEAVIPNDTKVIEIDLSDVPCTIYSNFNISLKYDYLFFYNFIEYNGQNVFYNDRGVIRLEGNYKKGDKYKLECDFTFMNDIDKALFINYLASNLIIAKNKRTIKSVAKKVIHKIRKG